MSQFARVAHSSSEEEVNKLISQGWELIDTNRRSFGDGSVETQHVLGLTYKTIAEGLLTVVKSYEKSMSKEDLFKAKAEELGEDYSQYGSGGFYSTNNELTKFMVGYENFVNNKQNASFYKNEPESESNFDTDDEGFLKF